MKTWMIYGANGYTAMLIATEAKKRHLTPILAGRNEKAIMALAQRLGLDYRVFDLQNEQALKQHLTDVDLVLNCAGPFSSTAKPMMDACIASNVHYLDITGEIAVFEYAKSQHERAQSAKMVLCPGVGFDVIPTDCLAAKLKQAMPDATDLALGFDSSSRLSPGTAKTAVEGLAQGSKVRINGRITTVPFAWKTRIIDFGKGEKCATTFPWGDVSSAYYSTGIPNIEAYIPMPPKRLYVLKIANYFKWLLRLSFIQNHLKHKASQNQGPSSTELEQQSTFIWGEVRNAKQQRLTARFVTANGYALTVTGSLAIVMHVLNEHPESGYTTPSRLMGADFASTLPGSCPIVFG